MDSRRFGLGLALAVSLALPAPAAAAALHDQYNNEANPATPPPTPTFVTATEGYEIIGTRFPDSIAADDFVVPAGKQWSLERVDAKGTGTGGPAPAAFNVFFFRSAGTVPEESALYSKKAVANPNAGSFTNYDANVALSPPASLGPGSYWVAVQGGVSSPFAWVTRTTQNGNPAAYRQSVSFLNANPNCRTFKTRAGCDIQTAGFPFGSGNPDQVFRLSGTESNVPVPPTVVGSPDLPPRFTGRISVKPNPFPVDLAGKAEAPVKGQSARRKRKGPKKGTSFRYPLSEAASVTFTIERKRKGRKVGRKCRKQTKKNKAKRKCSRYTRVGAFRKQSAAGANRKPFSGKVGRKKLRPGRYRATLVAVDAGGNRSKPARASFRVVRARKRK